MKQGGDKIGGGEAAYKAGGNCRADTGNIRAQPFYVRLFSY